MNLAPRLFHAARALATLFLIALPAFPAASGESPVPGQQAQRFEKTIRRDVSIPYLAFLPKDYDAKADRRWPLMIFLHGAGERGTNLAVVTVHGPPKLVKDRLDFPFVVISPQCEEGRRWDVEALNALLDDLLARYAVDPKRVYLTGLSMGGYGTWAWAGAYPERFAAIAPICGGGEPIGVWLSGGAHRQALGKLAIWAFHGAKDSVVPLMESERMADAYRAVGASPKLTVYPEANHDSWSATYANPELYEWMLQHQRP